MGQTVIVPQKKGHRNAYLKGLQQTIISMVLIAVGIQITLPGLIISVFILDKKDNK